MKLTAITASRLLSALALLAAGMVGGPAWAQSYSRTEVLAYYDDTSITNPQGTTSSIWVLGQSASVTCKSSVPISTSCNGDDVISATTYDSVYAMAETTSSFGATQSTRSYDFTSPLDQDQLGTLRTIKDGNNKTTVLTTWKRGIPQLVTNPSDAQTAASSSSAVVDDYGLVGSVTTEAALQTRYEYDDMGRLKTISYPTGGPVAWNDTTQEFVRIAVADAYLPAGHWRQIVQTGKGKITTYFTAYWQPAVIVTEDTDVASTRSFVVNRYDAMGRKIFTSYPVGTFTSYDDQTLKGVWTDYDALGRPIQVRQDSELAAPNNVLRTTISYDTGFATTVTNPRNFRTTTSYQTFDQPSTDAPVKIIRAVGRAEEQTTTITRDPFGKPLTITRSGNGG